MVLDVVLSVGSVLVGLLVLGSSGDVLTTGFGLLMIGLGATLVYGSFVTARS